jgi:hypothetical protein
MGEVARLLMDTMGQAMTGGNGLESFSDMVDGAERWGTKIEKMEQKRVVLHCYYFIDFNF